MESSQRAGSANRLALPVRNWKIPDDYVPYLSVSFRGKPPFHDHNQGQQLLHPEPPGSEQSILHRSDFLARRRCRRTVCPDGLPLRVHHPLQPVRDRRPDSARGGAYVARAAALARFAVNWKGAGFPKSARAEGRLKPMRRSLLLLTMFAGLALVFWSGFHNLRNRRAGALPQANKVTLIPDSAATSGPPTPRTHSSPHCAENRRRFTLVDLDGKKVSPATSAATLSWSTSGGNLLRAVQTGNALARKASIAISTLTMDSRS